MIENIADSFTELLKTHPYSKITIQMICDNTPISRNAFYYHYRNKEDLVEQICYRDYVKNAIPYFTIAADNIRHKVFFQYIIKKKDFYNALYAADGGKTLYRCLAYAFYEGMAQEYSKDYAPPVHSNKRKIDSKLFRHYNSAGIAAVILFWIETGMKTPIEDIAKDMTIIFTKSPEEIITNHMY